MQKLTKEQQKLIEDNYGLLTSFLKQHNLSEDSVEDWYGLLSIAFCKAAQTYNPNKNVKFSTYAYIVMNNARLKRLRDSKHNISCLSLDEIRNNGCDEYSLYDIIPSSKNTLHDEIIPKDLEDFIYRKFKELKFRDQQIVSLIINKNMKQVDVAKQFKLKKQTVNKVYNDFINKIQDFINGGDEI